jgi:probable phosphoglycerate mutase
MSDVLRALAARDWGKRRRITLLRHGAVSYYEADGTPVPSADDVPLNELGRNQATAAGQALRESTFDRLIVSGLPRTIETAQRVLAENHHGTPPTETWPELREIRGGKPDDIREDEAEIVFTQVFGKPSNFDVRFLGGELLGDFTDRVHGAFARILADPSWQELLMVLHGGTNRAILSYCLTGGQRQFLGALHQTPACINLVDVGDVAKADFVVRAINIAPPDLMQGTTRKTTLEELFEKYLAYKLDSGAQK